MGLVEEINRLLASHPQEKISGSQVVKAMILNGLDYGLLDEPRIPNF
jgi:hypothetical protein